MIATAPDSTALAAIAPEILAQAERWKQFALDAIAGAGSFVSSTEGDEIGSNLARWRSNRKVCKVWSESDEAEYERLVAQTVTRHCAYLANKYELGSLSPQQQDFIYQRVWGRTPLFYLAHDEIEYAKLTAFALGFVAI